MTGTANLVGASPNTSEAIHFADFRLLPEQRQLFRGEHAISLGHRALDLLILLVQKAGQYLTKDEISNAIWPRTVVVDGTLRVHITGLRKALHDGRNGQRFIINVRNRGYSFIAPVARGGTLESKRMPVSRPPRTLPSLVSPILGRTGMVDALARQLQHERFISLVGPGGIGKTSLAVAVARQLQAEGPGQHGVLFVDLASVFHPQLVASAIALAAGLPCSHQDPVPQLISFLGTRSTLIVLDNCEHVVAAAAHLAEKMLAGAPGLRILATSREVLRASGEHVHRLRPLPLPPRTPGMSAKQAISHAGVELFVERLSAARGGYCLQDGDVACVVDICHRMDGIPLAIEIAAMRAARIGLRFLASRLADDLSLLGPGRRTVAPRHQTLRASLDWSYGLLPPLEQRLLAQLSRLAGSFTYACALEVSKADGIDDATVLALLGELVDKSLLDVDVSEPDTSFRMQETTRCYASDLQALIAPRATVRAAA